MCPPPWHADAPLPPLPTLSDGLDTGARETVVEQWLRRNAEMMARLRAS